MKLYECPRNSLVRVIGGTSGPPASRPVQDNEVVKFYHTDGMYSYCKNEAGDIVHLPAWQEVELLNEVEITNGIH